MPRMRPAAAALALLTLSCAGPRGSSPEAAAAAPEPALLHPAELARVRCLLVAPFENASDVPLAADAATSAILSGVDPSRARVFPIPELRALFRDTPLELPEGIGGSLALELAELLGADAVVHGAVEGRGREGGGELLISVRLALAPRRDLLFAASAPVRPEPGEPIDAAVRRVALDTVRPFLDRLGDPGRRHCFDPERTRALRTLALAETRPAPGSAAALPPPPLPPPPPVPAARPAAAPVQPRTPRQADWARRLGAAGRFVVEDVAFAGRTAELQRDGGLADLAVALAATPGVKVRIEAFVDASSDPEGDARLSGMMAQAALRRLVELGVGEERVSWAGRGGDSPRLPNFTVRGRSANRRLEVVGLK